MNIEIERKFLLKGVPDRQPEDKIDIIQWYLKNTSGVWERARSCYSEKSGIKFQHTIKQTISPGVNQEDEKEITSQEFNQFVESCKTNQSRCIHKTRLIFTEGELKWEVDVFKNGIDLVIAELEIPEENFEVIMPKFINSKFLIEVTGIKKFSNRNLAHKFFTPQTIKTN